MPSPDFEPGGPFGWGEWGLPGQRQTGKFNALHMALIPKGPWRGRVLVWNRYPVYVNVGATYAQLPGSTLYWACQAWSIVNPAPNAPAPRFRNFLLPMTTAGNTAPSTGALVEGANLFCSGHAWSAAGELVVAGGDKFTWMPTSMPPLQQAVGAKWLFLFDPASPSSPFPGGTVPLYAGEVGAWKRPPGSQPNTFLELDVDRYYPTVTMTHRLNRISPAPTETMIVTGGSDPNSATGFPGGNDPRNTYESYVVRPNGSPQPFLEQDLVAGMRVFRGPGTTTNVYADWMLEYPRVHLLSDGKLFLSGFVPNGVRWDPEHPATTFPPAGPSQYDYTIGIGSTSVWNDRRDYGSTVFLARYGTFDNLVLRLGGGYTPPLAPIGSIVATASSEFCFATQLNGPWNSLGDVPGLQTGRAHSNAVVLPDGSVFVVGGNDATGFEPETARYTPATSWQPDARSPTNRGYHAAMLALPDGRVFVGGGDDRFTPLAGTDYDIYEPAYLHGAPRPRNVSMGGIPQDAEGTYLLGPNQPGIQLRADVAGMAYLDRLVLMAPGSVTHHSDMSARYVELQSVAIDSRTRIFSVPAETVAPRGYYMLFAVDNGGIPAEAIWVRIQ